MRINKSQYKLFLHRIYFIDKEIASGTYPSTQSMAEAYEKGTATISRDIDFMKNALGAPIEYDPLRRGFYYSEKTFRLPASFATADDMLALGMAKVILSLLNNYEVIGNPDN